MPAQLFVLRRTEDVSGVSGVGDVAEGAVWSDGSVTIRWFGAYASTVIWDSLENAMAVHGHRGTTQAVFENGTVYG